MRKAVTMLSECAWRDAQREHVTMRRIAGASYCPLPLSQAVLVEKGKHKVY